MLSAIGVSVYHGHDGLRSWFGQLDDAWEELRVEAEAYFDLGEQTLLFHVLRGRGKHSGAEVAMHGAQLCGWRDGLGIYAKQYAHREEALRDLSISEDALERIAPTTDLACRSRTLTPSPETAGYCAGDVGGERGYCESRLRGMERGAHG